METGGGDFTGTSLPEEDEYFRKEEIRGSGLWAKTLLCPESDRDLARKERAFIATSKNTARIFENLYKSLLHYLPSLVVMSIPI